MGVGGRVGGLWQDDVRGRSHSGLPARGVREPVRTWLCRYVWNTGKGHLKARAAGLQLWLAFSKCAHPVQPAPFLTAAFISRPLVY